MKKLIGLIFFAVFTLTSCASQARYNPFAYNQDFSIKVKVPNTDSELITKPQKMDTEMTALELSKKMGNGINLGNTLEAYRGWNGNAKGNAKSYERMWGQPLTTASMMVAYKKAGFDSIRIPVAWTNMMPYEKQDYTINKKWLDRVEEVVNYALDAGLYVIINDHWDGQWWGMFGSMEEEHRVEAIKLYKSLWTQVANRFKNYDEKLIFEGANEELGFRLNDDTVFSNKRKGNLSEWECYDATNKINQCFVDLVRSTGGNNKNRFLLIAGFDTDIDRTCSELFKMPKDSVKNRLLISVHYYTPSVYCILNEDASWGKCKNNWGTESEYDLMNTNFEKMKKFVDQGYGVIIGEYGVSAMKNGKAKEGMTLWLKNVLDNCDKYNYVPMLWDCNTFFKKENGLGFTSQELKDLYKNR